jgi:hypothetical protein
MRVGIPIRTPASGLRRLRDEFQGMPGGIEGIWG